jgi:hypothetical protein
MKNKKLVSLRGYRARRLYDRFFSLPASQRTNERSAQMLEAIFDYAYEFVPNDRRRRNGRVRVTPEESGRISRRLEEFMVPESKYDPDSVMNWLHANMVPEAWAYPDDLRGLVREIIHNDSA